MSNAMNDQDFEKLLQTVMKAPAVPAQLQDRLMALASDDTAAAAGSPPVQFQQQAANGDSFWRRALPVAASLAIFLLLAYRFHPLQNPPLEQEILRHVYAEERFLESTNQVSLVDVNSRMNAAIKAQLAASPATNGLDVRFAKDCWIAKQVAMHIILRGDTGPVSIMMLPSKMVDHATAINDDRFTGTITPMASGTLVVLGNRKEPLQKYASLVSANLRWEY